MTQTTRGIGTYDGLARIEAENYSETGGVLKEECSEGGFHVSFDTGDSLVFNKLDFGEEEKNNINLRVASKSEEGSIEIYTKIGDLLGIVSIPNTGSSDNWQTLSGQILLLSGEESIYLKYLGADANPIHLNWIDFAEPAVGIFDQKKNTNELHIYPNPADDFVYLNLPGHIQEVFVRIYNSSGNLVQLDHVLNERLDIEHLYTGIYYILINDVRNKISYQENLVIN